MSRPTLDLAAVFARNRAIFGDARMELTTDAPPDRDTILAEYRALSDDDLTAEREVVLADLDEGTDETVLRADLLADLIGERNAAAEAAQARRDRLSSLTVVRRSVARVDRPVGPVREQTHLTHTERGYWEDLTERFTSSPSFQRFMDEGCHGRAAIEVPDFLTRATILSTDVAGIQPTQLGLQPVREYPLSILDLIGTSSIGTNAVSWVVDTSVDTDLVNPKNPVAEGALKPEATFTFDEYSAVAQVIAGWLAITRQALEDNPSLQGYLSQRLTRKVRMALANEVLNGTGVAPRLQGILPLATPVAAGADAFATISSAIAIVEGAGHVVNGIVINPADWSRFMTDATSGTYGNQVNPFAAPQKTLWGHPVVTDPMITAGTSLVGDFTEDTFYFRNDVRLLVADQHADLFLKNTLVLLGECRGVNVITAPTAFAVATLPVALP